MLKNILSAVGLYFVAKKGYEHYQEYSELGGRRSGRRSRSKRLAKSQVTVLGLHMPIKPLRLPATGIAKDGELTSCGTLKPRRQTVTTGSK